MPNNKHHPVISSIIQFLMYIEITGSFYITKKYKYTENQTVNIRIFLLPFILSPTNQHHSQ